MAILGNTLQEQFLVWLNNSGLNSQAWHKFTVAQHLVILNMEKYDLNKTQYETLYEKFDVKKYEYIGESGEKNDRFEYLITKKEENDENS